MKLSAGFRLFVRISFRPCINNMEKTYWDIIKITNVLGTILYDMLIVDLLSEFFALNM